LWSICHVQERISNIDASIVLHGLLLICDHESNFLSWVRWASFATASASGLILVAMKVPLQEHEGLVILPFVLVFGIGCQYALAGYMKKIVKWVAVDG